MNNPTFLSCEGGKLYITEIVSKEIVVLCVGGGVKHKNMVLSTELER